MTRLYLANEIRQELIDQGITRAPENVELAPLPPCFVEAPEGCPAPDDVAKNNGEEVSAVVNVTYQGGEPTQSFEGFREVRGIGIEVRSADAKTGIDLCQEIAEALDDKIHALLGDLLVSNCTLIEQPTRVPWRYPGPGVTYTMSFRVGLRRSDYLIED
jgi:hypothetical protein